MYDLSVFYGNHQAVDGISINVNPEEIVAILGANGAGKSICLKAISGLTILMTTTAIRSTMPTIK